MFRLYIRHTRSHRYMWWISTTRSPKKTIEIDHRVQREKTIADDEPLRRTKQTAFHAYLSPHSLIPLAQNHDDNFYRIDI